MSTKSAKRSLRRRAGTKKGCQTLSDTPFLVFIKTTTSLLSVTTFASSSFNIPLPVGERLGEGQVYRETNPPLAPPCKGGGFIKLLLAS